MAVDYTAKIESLWAGWDAKKRDEAAALRRADAILSGLDISLHL